MAGSDAGAVDADEPVDVVGHLDSGEVLAAGDSESFTVTARFRLRPLM